MNEPVGNEIPLYNSRITNTYLKLIKQKYSYIDVNELLRYAAIEPYQVEDEGHWFSQRQINRFHERLQRLTGNKNIAREAGLYSVSPEAQGGLKQYLLGLVSPAAAYILVGKYTNRFTRSSTYVSKRIGPNQVEIQVTPKQGVREEPFQCENRQGYLDAVSRLFNYRLPRIEHPECIFAGGRSCRYIVSWQESPATNLKKARNICLVVLVIANIWLPFLLPDANQLSALLGSGMLIAGLSCYAQHLRTREFKKAVDNLGVSSDKLFDQINENYNNALMVNEIGHALSDESHIDGVLASVSSILENRLDYDRGLVMLANPTKTRLLYRAGYGYTDEQLAVLKKIAFQLDNPESKGIFVLSFRNKEPCLLNDIDSIKQDLSPRSYEFARQMGVKSLICCPIVYKEGALGILAVDNIRSKRPLLQRDLNLLMGVATQIGGRVYNLMIEDQLRQSQKMKAVGRLAGGVAHDFNNILTTILGYSQLLSQELPEDHPAQRKIATIHQAGEKAAGLTRQLLAFSRKQVMEMKITNLNQIIEDMGKMLARMIGEDIDIELRTKTPVGNIMADAGQVEQVLMNLAVNARDAMPCGGRLVIETGNAFLDEKYARAHRGLKSGHYAVLTVTDTGDGMSAAVRNRIFDPFFTTKEKEKGTGLGLSTVYGIVKQHQGHIHVYSEPGKGSTFKIYFPVTEGTAEKKTAEKATPMARGSESILVVDDDSEIRRLTTDTLAPLGYMVMEAACGEEALLLSRNSKNRIDLVLSDVVMPGLNGRELCAILQKERPAIKTILMSGYTDNIVAHRGILEPGLNFINKPLVPVTLASKIRQVLDQKQK